MLTVVAMGLNKDDLTIKGLNVLKNADVVIVKSERTHMSETLKEQDIEYISCDDLYDKAEDFLELDKLIVKRLNQQQGNIAFCIVGSGTDDSTVDYLKQHNVPFETVYGVSADMNILRTQACKYLGDPGAGPDFIPACFGISVEFTPVFCDLVHCSSFLLRKMTA